MSRFCVELTQVGYEAATQSTPMVRHCCGYFLCDTAADIPDQDAYSSDNIKLMIGSKAKVISTNSTYMMQQDGTWVIQEVGNDYYSKAEVDEIASYEGIRLLRQGEEIPELANLDSYDTAGVYYSPNSTRTSTLYNRPWSGSGFKLLVWSISTTSKQQWVMPMSNSAHSLFFRNRTTSGWRPWYEIEGVEISTINPYPVPQALTSMNPSLLQGTNFNPEITSVEQEE